MIDALVTAVRTLTTIPIPGRDARDMSRSLPWFVGVGALLGALVAAVGNGSAAIFGGQPLVVGALTCLAGAALTGALHIDGLADSADAFLGGRDRDSVLRILKDSRIGCFGATAVGFDLLLKAALCGQLVVSGLAIVVALSMVLARTVQALMLSMMPYARGSEGTAHPFSSGGRFLPVLAAEIVACAALVYWSQGWHGTAAVGIAGVAAVLLCVYFMRRIQGITGDCVGATSEVFEVVFLACMCATPHV
jgi:adenosylcobinamide-GDP ribazoletransferase